jgi:cytochrome c-type biogenesis protein CcmH/NrfF
VKRLLPVLIMLVLMPGFSLPVVAADRDLRYNDLGLRIQCPCGCNQELIKCNHVGCQYSDNMIRQLRAAINNYSNDEDVLNWFRRTYGMTVVNAPATHGFELSIWVLPGVLTIAGLVTLFLVTRRWRARAAPVDVTPVDPKLEDLKARARKETEL